MGVFLWIIQFLKKNCKRFYGFFMDFLLAEGETKNADSGAAKPDALPEDAAESEADVASRLWTFLDIININCGLIEFLSELSERH